MTHLRLPALLVAALLVAPALADVTPEDDFQDGVRFFKGEGVDQDRSKAAIFFETAAGSGHASAAFWRGFQSLKGLGVPLDKPEAARWFEKGAQMGHPRAAYNLARLLADGTGGRRDRTAARKWFQVAADEGHDKAAAALAAMDGTPVPRKGASPEDPDDDPTTGPAPGPARRALRPLSPRRQVDEIRRRAEERGQAQDHLDYGDVALCGCQGAPAPRAAAEQYRQAARTGDAEAMFRLGRLAETGATGIRNQPLAHKRYSEAAAAGSARAMTRLAYQYLDGRGVDVDYAEARRLFTAAAEAGERHAATVLGFMLLTGRGLGVLEADAALKWIEMGAEEAHPHALLLRSYLPYDPNNPKFIDLSSVNGLREIAELELDAAALLRGLRHCGDSMPDDVAVRAVGTFREAALAGLVIGDAGLGLLHHFGKGVEPDAALALEYLQTAADSGDPLGAQLYADLRR